MKIAIITGGSGPERDVSIRSAENIKKNINFAETETFLYPEEYERFVIKSNEFDLAIPMIHGHDGEDGKIQDLLKKKGVKYIFSDSKAHAICFNKELSKKYAEEAGFKTPKTFLYTEIKNHHFPLIAKPKKNGSSIGIHFLENRKDLEKIGFLDDYIYEEYIDGKEYTVGVIHTKNGNIALPVMEARIEKKIFSYDDKYSKYSQNIEIFPSNMSEKIHKELLKRTIFVHNIIELSHLSRSDFIVNKNGEIHFLEINSIPGCTEDSWVPKMIKKANFDFEEVIKFWCENVLKNKKD